MLLAVDVGNTQTAIGVFDGEELAQTWGASTLPSRTADELALVFSAFLGFKGLNFDTDITGFAISSVVPRITQELREMAERYFRFEAFVVGPGIKTGMPVLIDNPKEVGADRIVNAVATHARFGGPAVVIDLGTATTFDAVSAKGEYLGGAIAPGLDTSTNALVARTAMLKRIEYTMPEHAIGKSTVEALQSGIVLGYASLIDGMIRRFRDELGTDAKTVLTGGLAEVMAPSITAVDVVDPWLVLRGLRILHERNA